MKRETKQEEKLFLLRFVRNYKRGNYIHVTYIHTSTYTRTEILYIQEKNHDEIQFMNVLAQGYIL